MSYSSSSDESDASSELPEELNSIACLKFVGFSPLAAEKIFATWQAAQRGPMSLDSSLLDEAVSHIKANARYLDAWDDDDDWQTALSSMGMSTEMCERILDPEFAAIRLTGCACYWATDSVLMSWQFLENLDRRIVKQHAKGGRHTKTAQHDNGSRSETPAHDFPPGPAIRPLSSARPVRSEVPQTATATPPISLSDRTMLYKGANFTRLASVFRADESIDLDALRLTPPTDFHPTAFYLYFTKQRDVAESYARYAHNRLPADEPALLVAAVPSAMLANPRQVFGGEWRDLVWNSRNRAARVRNNNTLPTTALREIAEADVTMGEICRNSRHKIDRMSTPAELESLTTLNGGRATQWVFQTPKIISDLRVELGGFVWVDTLPMPEEGHSVSA